ncbi:MAG: metallophosphoesterase [Vicinamibacteria bacterium]|nr:metallophosphoesterase [Vicinamibacteria bacterium]
MERLASRFALSASFALAALPLCGAAQELTLPNRGQVRFAVIGDMGTASRAQREVAQQMVRFHAKFPFTFVITVGDNILGPETARDFKAKFEAPYADLLAAGIKFYASLGNHDNPEQRNYGPFSMDGQRYYTFSMEAPGGLRFFALDSNYMDAPQLAWLEKELSASGSEWKLAFFHHPLYSSGKTHGSSLDLRKTLEPLFTRYGVDVVFTGHDHFYERVKPQHAITYFVAGSAGSLRKGDYRKQPFSAVGFDRDYAFLLVEIDGAKLHFQAISRTGQTVDSGVIALAPAQPTATPGGSPLPLR